MGAKMKATAKAHSNIALIKYWGKRDSNLMLPQNSSISMTLDKFYTITTVEFSEKQKEDELFINNEKQLGEELEGIKKPLDEIRKKAKISLKAKIFSENNFPTAAGLASSASGFAALALAASTAAGLKLNEKELSILARLGSGSASRSILGGFVEWQKGEKADGSDSYAVQIANEKHWLEFKMLVTIVSAKEKKIKSRAGMSQTVKTCPYYKAWLETINEDLNNVRKGIKEKNFSLVGSTAEFNALKMHATMITTKPSIIYWQPLTMQIIHLINELRDSGLECYFTIDAGPNVKVMCLEKDEKKLIKELEAINDIKTVSCSAGPKASLINKHLF